MPWFDPNTGDLLFDDYVVERPSYRKILEDRQITDEEIEDQAEKVLSLFRSLENVLAPEAKDVATEALCELAVLNDLQLKRLQIERSIR